MRRCRRPHRRSSACRTRHDLGAVEPDGRERARAPSRSPSPSAARARRGGAASRRTTRRRCGSSIRSRTMRARAPRRRGPLAWRVGDDVTGRLHGASRIASASRWRGTRGPTGRAPRAYLPAAVLGNGEPRHPVLPAARSASSGRTSTGPSSSGALRLAFTLSGGTARPLDEPPFTWEQGTRKTPRRCARSRATAT